MKKIVLTLSPMDSTRQNKIARLLQKDISEILQLNSRAYYGGSMVTVTKVRVSSDLALAKTYVSIFVTGQGDKASVLKNINDHVKEIRRDLGNRVKNQLRVIPDLEFILDDSLDYIENIENLLKK
jgi:ribosome-binding factor A